MQDIHKRDVKKLVVTFDTAAPILFSNLNSSVLSLPLIDLEPAQAYVGPVAPPDCIPFVPQRPGALISNSGAASSLANNKQTQKRCQEKGGRRANSCCQGEHSYQNQISFLNI